MWKTILCYFIDMQCNALYLRRVSQVCCPREPPPCIFFPGEEEPECAREEGPEIAYYGPDDIAAFYNGWEFNNYNCSSIDNDYDYEPDYQDAEYDCKPIGECTTEGMVEFYQVFE